MIRQRTLIVPYLVLTFLVQTLLPFFATYTVPQKANAQEMAALYGDKIILCTSEGFKLVSWDEAFEHQAPQHESQYKCALCYVAAHGQAIATPVAQIASSAFIAGQPSLLLSRVFVAAEDRWRESLTRSPPHSHIV